MDLQWKGGHFSTRENCHFTTRYLGHFSTRQGSFLNAPGLLACSRCVHFATRHGSNFLGLLVSRFLGFSVSWRLRLLVSGFLGFWVSWFLGFSLSCFQSFLFGFKFEM